MTMDSRLPKALGVSMLLLLTFSSLAAVAAHAQEGGYAPPTPMPIWATFNASAQGNYPGGDEQFYAFVVNSAQTPGETEIVDNMTVTAPFFTNFAPGLPATLTPGESLLATITLPIPQNITLNQFSGNLVVHARIWNGTVYQKVSLTGAAVVSIFYASPQSAASATTTTSQSASQPGTISTTLFAAGVAVPTIIVIILLILLVRSRTGPKV
jgi:hypothetical protein